VSTQFFGDRKPVQRLGRGFDIFQDNAQTRAWAKNQQAQLVN
jgi:hypothetical protein